MLGRLPTGGSAVKAHFTDWPTSACCSLYSRGREPSLPEVAGAGAYGDWPAPRSPGVTHWGHLPALAHSRWSTQVGVPPHTQPVNPDSLCVSTHSPGLPRHCVSIAHLTRDGLGPCSPQPGTAGAGRAFELGFGSESKLTEGSCLWAGW